MWPILLNLTGDHLEMGNGFSFKNNINGVTFLEGKHVEKMNIQEGFWASDQRQNSPLTFISWAKWLSNQATQNTKYDAPKRRWLHVGLWLLWSHCPRTQYMTVASQRSPFETDSILCFNSLLFLFMPIRSRDSWKRSILRKRLVHSFWCFERKEKKKAQEQTILVGTIFHDFS